MRNDDWQTLDFSKYDTIIYVSAIVHIKERAELEPLYMSVNAEKPFKVALKAKEEGVKHFIFLSTKAVYKSNTPLITRETALDPETLYGKSKLYGERKIIPLGDEQFKVSVLRPPVVYGEGCKGNFPSLEKLSKLVHVFPKKYNVRSMIYIWNLCEFIRRIVDTPFEETIFFPQNHQYSGTLHILEELWKARKEKYVLIKSANFFVDILLKYFKVKKIKTMFCDTVYDESLSNYFNYEYCVFSFRESIENIIEQTSKS